MNKLLLNSPYKRCLRVVHKGGLKYFILSIMLSVEEIKETSGIGRETVCLTGDHATFSCSLFLHPLTFCMPEG